MLLEILGLRLIPSEARAGKRCVVIWQIIRVWWEEMTRELYPLFVSYAENVNEKQDRHERVILEFENLTLSLLLGKVEKQYTRMKSNPMQPFFRSFYSEHHGYPVRL